jgi:threonine dehydrogenase-like Zn-dependent dehydrogenase
MFGGYAGAQAQYVRVPFADFGSLEVLDDAGKAIKRERN